MENIQNDIYLHVLEAIRIDLIQNVVENVKKHVFTKMHTPLWGGIRTIVRDNTEGLIYNSFKNNPTK